LIIEKEKGKPTLYITLVERMRKEKKRIKILKKLKRIFLKI
jgi:hypothetical protein